MNDYISTEESRTKLLNDLRKKDMIELYKNMYEKYCYLIDLLDDRSSLDVLSKDTLQSSFIGGMCGLTIAIGAMSSENLNSYLFVPIGIGALIGSWYPLGDVLRVTYQIDKLEKQLVDIATKLKILEDSNLRYFVYPNENSIDENIYNSCTQTQPALGAVYKIVCRK